MTLKELYQSIGEDYDQAMRVLRVEKLLDKHIRRFQQNGVVEELLKAGDEMDPTKLFETAHAVKGVCANLGLKKLSDAAAEITEEYRPGSVRRLSDEEVKGRLASIREMYENVVKGIQSYEKTCG